MGWSKSWNHWPLGRGSSFGSTQALTKSGNQRFRHLAPEKILAATPYSFESQSSVYKGACSGRDFGLYNHIK